MTAHTVALESFERREHWLGRYEIGSCDDGRRRDGGDGTQT